MQIGLKNKDKQNYKLTRKTKKIKNIHTIGYD